MWLWGIASPSESVQTCEMLLLLLCSESRASTQPVCEGHGGGGLGVDVAEPFDLWALVPHLSGALQTGQPAMDSKWHLVE